VNFSRLATKYVGSTASQYEAKRRTESKWRAEDEAAEQLLAGIADGARMLDIPIGTGRLLPLIKQRGFDAYGLDISPDMLAIARARAEVADTKVELGIGDIRDIPFDDNHFDLVTCLRFLNWLDERGVERAMRQLARVAGGRLLVGIRYLPPLRELMRHRRWLIRLGMRAIGLPRLQAHRTALFFHRMSFVHGLFARIGLDIVDQRLIERRIDGTDYVFFLLKKR
jgi:ubiquinone/menaquinone biosynthesis C-methylase UbiE